MNAKGLLLVVPYFKQQRLCQRGKHKVLKTSFESLGNLQPSKQM